MLVFHSMIIFALEDRFRQLIIKSCLAILLGWHVLTLLVPFVVIGLFKTGFMLGPAHTKNYGKSWVQTSLLRFRIGIAAMVTCRYMVLGAVVGTFSILVLVYIEVFDFPVLEPMTRRLGLDSESNQIVTEQAEWTSFLRDQLIRIGLMSIPFALPGYSSTPTWWKGGDLLGISESQNLFIGVVVVGVCVVGMFFVRYRLLTMTAVVSGVYSIILWRYDISIYGHDIGYYIGLTLVFFALIFALIWRSTSELLMGFISAISVLIFVFSAFQMSFTDHYGRLTSKFLELDRLVDRVMDSSLPISRDYFDVYLGDERTLVYVRTPCRSEDVTDSFFLHIFPVDVEDLPGDRPAFGFYNRVFNFDSSGIMDSQRCAIEIELPDYDIASIRTGQLTDSADRIWDSITSDPYNVVYPGLNLRVDQTVSSREPVISGHFDVYLGDDRTLVYVRAPCRNEDVIDRFFLHIFPVDVEDLPGDRPAFGFDNLDYDFGDRGPISSQRCAIEIELPDYDIASIRTGQFTDGEGQIWTGEFDLADG